MRFLFLITIFFGNIACQESGANSKQTELEISPPSLPEYLNLEYLTGHFNPKEREDFSLIPLKMASRKGMYLRKEVLQAFEKMQLAAKKDGLNLKIVSATRNFNAQKRIWEAKWKGARKVNGQDLSKMKDLKKRALTILTYSSMPGTSRHHWGTDLDINSVNPSYFENGNGKKIYEWLSANAANYGFCQPYTPKGDNRPHGYNEEKWHWSYSPVANMLTEFAAQNLKNEDVSGFLGAEVASGINIVNHYILGISQACK